MPPVTNFTLGNFCDGGDWRPKTTALVVAHLRERLPEYLVIG